MKVVKPTRVGLLQRVFENGRDCYFVVTSFLFFPLSDPRRLLSDVSLWKTALSELTPGSVLDLGMPKPVGEVIVDGVAYAGATPQPACKVRFRVGEIDKSLLVVGDRHWQATGPSAPDPFTEMRLTWARSFGGESFAKNPLGKGAHPVRCDGKLLHPLANIEDPRRSILSKDERPDPLGFAAYDVSWPQRASKMGTYDAKWLRTRSPGYAADLDLALFSAAPRDQQLREGYFAGDEAFLVENMHATAKEVSGALPGLDVRVFVTHASHGEETLKELEARLDTVHLFPSVDRGALVFRSMLKIAEDDAADVRNLLVACEQRNAPKPASHYADVLARRLDRKVSHLVRLDDDELLPMSFADQPLADDGPLTAMLARKGLQVENARRGAEKREAERAAREPVRSTRDDSPEGESALEARAIPAVDREATRAVGPPRYSAEVEHASAEARLASAKSAGLEMPELEALVSAPSYLDRLRQTQRSLEDVYRRDGHRQPPAAAATFEVSLGHRARLSEALESGATLTDRDFTGADLSEMDLTGIDLSGAFLEGASLRKTKLDRAKLDDAVLARADLTGASLRGASLARANLGESTLDEATLDDADLGGAILAGAAFVRTSLVRVRLSGGTLSGARFTEVDLTGAVARGLNVLTSTFVRCNFSESDWERCNFVECDFDRADFDRARLERATLMQSKLDGATFVGAHLHRLRLVQSTSAKDARFHGANLSMANLRSTDLSRSDFSEAHVEGADFSEACLEGASFHRAVAKDARFVRADCSGTIFTGANLMRALFSKANIARASFLGANAFRADFAHAKGDAATTFAEANLTQVRFTERPSS